MTSTIVIDRQSLLDIALQEYGNVQAAFDLAMANGLDITNELMPGQELILLTSKDTDNEILNLYKTKDIRPVTLTPGINSGNTATGIGIMQLEKTTNTFIVG